MNEEFLFLFLSFERKELVMVPVFENESFNCWVLQFELFSLFLMTFESTRRTKVYLSSSIIARLLSVGKSWPKGQVPESAMS